MKVPTTVAACRRIIAKHITKSTKLRNEALFLGKEAALLARRQKQAWDAYYRSCNEYQVADEILKELEWNKAIDAAKGAK